jgi:hypothetical protein
MVDDIRPRGSNKAVAAKTRTVAKSKKTKAEPAFVPPEQIAENSSLIPGSPVEEIVEDSGPPKPPRRKFHFAAKFKELNGKQRLVLLVIILFITSGGGAVWAFTHRTPPPDNTVLQVKKYVPPEPPKPTTEASRLTGVQISPELNALPSTAVMIENSPDARPQSGILEAGVVHEMLVEGGISRFMVVYQEGQPGRIGPVRSARPPYLDFLLPYDAGYAHAGGSGEALAQIRALGIKDLDHGANGGAFQRDNNRYAPHNLYTSRAQLLAAQTSRGWGTSTYTGFPRKAEKPSEAPNARGIDLALSGFLYNPRFDYDAATNSYKRSMAGRPHVDETSGAQLSPKVVVALVSPHHYAGIYSVYQLTGSGKAYIFQDGMVTEGVWEKAGRNNQIKFGDANGAPLGLNPGQTWITLVSTADQVKITP